jgi:hypothetical protein
MTQVNSEQQKRQRQERLLRLAVRREVGKASDKLAPEVQTPAESMTRAPKLDTTQVRKLENLAYSTDKVSDITDFLKRQIGRSAHRERWRYDQVGLMVLDALTDLRRQAERIVKELRDNQDLSMAVDDDLPRRVHLALCREYVKHLVAEFLYRAK